MTSFSSPSIHRCPGCDAFYKQHHFRSVNFFGTEDWSDGVPTAWWRQEPLVRCNACAALFWRGDCEPVGVMPDPLQPIGRFARAWLRWSGDPDGRLHAQVEWDDIMRNWGPALPIGSVNFDDVVYVLSRSVGVSLDRVLWLRRRIWWRLNDRYRLGQNGMRYPDVPTWPTFAEHSNMEAMLIILQDNEADSASLIHQGELLRLLGRFDQAQALLATVKPDGYSEIRAGKIAALVKAGDTSVRELSPPKW